MSLGTKACNGSIITHDPLKDSGITITTTLKSSGFEVLIPKANTISPENKIIVLFNSKL